jgi:DHA1 family multidrug resistance protein-like MFS transporter
VIGKHLFVLLACLFVVMIGLGITMPLLPFYVERLALAEGVSHHSVVMHIGLLTGVLLPSAFCQGCAFSLGDTRPDDTRQAQRGVGAAAAAARITWLASAIETSYSGRRHRYRIGVQCHCGGLGKGPAPEHRSR